ncbi:hypothetical protein [Mesorhizobium australicum]|uniref:hypothetical protein n=1 Tax=Mesorhizobium australicum TaxID=536018 RepID=UPI003EB7D427
MPGLKIIPLVRFEKLRNEIGLARLAESAGPKTISLAVKDAKTGAPIAGARVVAFANYRHRTGAEPIRVQTARQRHRP